MREIAGILTSSGTRAQPASSWCRCQPPTIVSLKPARRLPRTAAEGTVLRESNRSPSVADDSAPKCGARHLPGVHSARWKALIRCQVSAIYELLDARGLHTARAVRVPRGDSGGRSHPSEAEIVEGQIPEASRDERFPGRPISITHPSGTLAELDLERKATVSHRGKAFAALTSHLAVQTLPPNRPSKPCEG